jgi:hypothetical protein
MDVEITGWGSLGRFCINIQDLELVAPLTIPLRAGFMIAGKGTRGSHAELEGQC